MHTGRYSVLHVAAILLALPVSACGSSSSEATSTSESIAAATTTTTTPPVAASSTTGASPEVTRDLLYATWTDNEWPLRIDMYLPADPEGAPLVIHLPGLDGSTPSWMAEALAGEGVIFFAVGYPRSSPPVPFSEHGLGARAMADSVGCAIRFARIRASELGSDDPVVVLSGFSLGGAPAAHAAMFGADLEAAWEEFAAEGGPPGQVACEVTGGSTHVDALVGMSGAYDVLAPIYDGKWGRSYQQEHDPELGSFLASAIGANPSLKVRLLHGEADGWIPYDNSTGFAAALADAGYDVEMIGFAGGHGEPPPEIAVPIIMDVAR